MPEAVAQGVRSPHPRSSIAEDRAVWGLTRRLGVPRRIRGRVEAPVPGPRGRSKSAKGIRYQ
jgi:hypothetical protein